MSITGHKGVQYLTIYQKTKDKNKEEMGNILRQSMVIKIRSYRTKGHVSAKNFKKKKKIRSYRANGVFPKLYRSDRPDNSQRRFCMDACQACHLRSIQLRVNFHLRILFSIEWVTLMQTLI